MPPPFSHTPVSAMPAVPAFSHLKTVPLASIFTFGYVRVSDPLLHHASAMEQAVSPGPVEHGESSAKTAPRGLDARDASPRVVTRSRSVPFDDGTQLIAERSSNRAGELESWTTAWPRPVQFAVQPIKTGLGVPARQTCSAPLLAVLPVQTSVVEQVPPSEAIRQVDGSAARRAVAAERAA